MLKDFININECSKCGICRSVCPIFLAVNDEVISPRGKISLVEAFLEEKITDIERYTDIIRSCIRCTRCSSVCPAGVRVEKIIQSARELLYSNMPPEAKEIFNFILNNPSELLQKMKEYSKNQRKNFPLWFLPLFFHNKAYLPQLAEKTVLDKYDEYIKADKNSSLQVSLFIGCSINYSNTFIADSAIEVLKKLNVNILIPKDQLCCSAPLLLYGDIEGAKEYALRNIKALKVEESDAIITLCPACGTTFIQDYEDIIGDNIDHFTNKIYDISEFIDIHTNYKIEKMDLSVTYHDPCYLRFGQKVFNEPRLTLAKSAKLIEMKDADKCCGLGGTLGLFHPEISEQIGKKKIESIIQTKADVVATGCPGCIMFIKDMLKRQGIDKEVLHTIQIFEKSLML
ncbi:MAG: (Fe-S)-binding protein [bacterium]